MFTILSWIIQTALFCAPFCPDYGEINAFASTLIREMHQMIENSEDLRIIEATDQQIWADQPSHMIVDRVHGGITPGIANDRPR